MIQRIQSLFLFLVDIVLVVLLFVPFTVGHKVADPAQLNPVTLIDYPLALVGQAILCVLAAAALAMFRKRKLQMTLCIIGMVISVLYSCLLVAFNSIANTVAENEMVYEIGIGTWISLANFLLFFLAWRFVKKDEELVKSMDRIR